MSKNEQKTFFYEQKTYGRKIQHLKQVLLILSKDFSNSFVGTQTQILNFFSSFYRCNVPLSCKTFMLKLPS